VQTEPFRLGTETYRYGVIYRWRGLFRSFGRK
jgi:hypothetical protein